MKRRLEDAEREKRDLLVVVSRLKDDASQREEEIQTLRESLRQSRKDQQQAENEVRELKTSEASTTVCFALHALCGIDSGWLAVQAGNCYSTT